MKSKERVLLTGASGSMGFESFKALWERREHYEIVLLLRPSARNKKMFREYEDQGLEVVWGDVLNTPDVIKACQGIDWCLHTMALISPAADRDPEMANRVNYLGTKTIVEAIEAQDPEHIRLVYVGTVAVYGDRLPPFHMGRAGDPVLPSKFDYYALSKIKAEQLVMQSRIKHRVSLRQTFIMINDLFSLLDPIMFHQPLNSHMENITARDSGRLMVSCLDLPDNSSFWGGYYNISGGPKCRTTFFELMESVYKMLGLRITKVMDRRWFALKNFHMVFYEDSGRLNSYLHHWEDGLSQEDYYAELKKHFPWYLKLISPLNKNIPPIRWLVEKATWLTLKNSTREEEGTMRWVKEQNYERINAFYGSQELFDAIPGWEAALPSLDHGKNFHLLDHGYEETKEELTAEDLQGAASFRGGSLKDRGWNGDMHKKVGWDCCLGHSFEMTPHAVLKGGHWCPECLEPPWKTEEIKTKNKFVEQLFPEAS